jgi:hypothetical protein
LAGFRVVVLSNLKLSDLTEPHQELLAEFCRELGGGVLMIGGANTFDASWQQSRLEQLLAVKFSSRSRRPADGRPFRLRVTPEALAHPVFQIGARGDQPSAWERLPTFRHYAPVDSVKPAARVWAVGDFGQPSAGRPVLIASQRYGAGRTAVICVQNLWRWRLARDSAPEHFDRFWQQLLRYLAEGNLDHVVLRVPDQRLQPGADIRVVVERRPNAQPQSAALARYRVRATDEEKQPVAERVLELAPGQTTEVAFNFPRPGLYHASVLDQHGAVMANRSLDIREVDSEFLHTSRDMHSLRQWANLNGGTAVPFEDCRDVGQLVDQIRAVAEQPRRSGPLRRPLGINGWMLALLLGCLCSEWLVRKRWGLV